MFLFVYKNTYKLANSNKIKIESISD